MKKLSERLKEDLKDYREGNALSGPAPWLIQEIEALEAIAAKYDEQHELLEQVQKSYQLLREGDKLLYKDLVVKAANWDMLERLPIDSGIVKDNRGLWVLIVNSIKEDLSDTPAEALKAFWSNREQE